MDINKLAAMAYFTLSIINEDSRMPSSLFSYHDSKYYNFSDLPSGLKHSIYDYGRSNYLTGDLTSNKCNAFDYATNNYLEFKLENTKVSVYDYESSSYIDIKVKGETIGVYSYKLSKYFNFSY